MFKRSMIAIVLAGSSALTMPVARAQKPVAGLDENRLVGSWFEIGRLPDKKQKTCASDSVKLITRWEKPGTLEWVDACTMKSRFNDARTSYAHPMPKRKDQAQMVGNGEYKVYTIWPLSKKYEVLGIANDNSWLVVGTPNRKNLWIYDKSRTMTPEVLSAAKQVATMQGYDLGKLVEQPQNMPASATVTDVAGTP